MSPADPHSGRPAEAPSAPSIPDLPLVAVVLPPGEGFGPGHAGAVGLIVRRLTRLLPSVVIGGPQRGPVFEDVAFHPVRPPAFWPPGGANARYAAGVARVLRGLRPALIEVHNRADLALALARRLPGVPVSLFLHNDPQHMRKARSIADRTGLLARLARVVTVSEFLRGRLLEGLPAPARAPAVLPNAIDLAALPLPAAREQLILFTGRVVADKGADAFVAACRLALPRLPGWRAEMIGADRFRADSPDTPYIRSIRREAARAGVAMLGYRPHSEVLEALARAAIAVVPSRWAEPFGLAALEAMASGAALICSRQGGLPEVAGDAALYVDPTDPATIAEAIEIFAADPVRRAAMAEAGHARARRFALEPAVLKLAALRQEILAERQGS